MKRFEELRVLAERQVEKTLRSLPDSLLATAQIPVLLERRPSRQDVEEGIDADVLGLFVGPALSEAESGWSGEAPHILLYLENIWDEAGEDLEIFQEEVEITFLHELGHYLNWDEEDLEERGLG